MSSLCFFSCFLRIFTLLCSLIDLQTDAALDFKIELEIRRPLPQLPSLLHRPLQWLFFSLPDMHRAKMFLFRDKS